MYPHAVQAGAKVSIEDARAQWTTHDNLSQWFDDAKNDLIATGLVDDKEVYDNNGELLSEHVKRAETQMDQVEMLLSSGKAFSASGQWNLCSSRIGNAGVTLEAQKRQLELNEEARLACETKKNEAHAKTLEKAQTALEKYNVNENTLNDKDWGDVIRWVLLTAKVDHLLKDLKRKDQIILKLATTM